MKWLIDHVIPFTLGWTCAGAIALGIYIMMANSGG